MQVIMPDKTRRFEVTKGSIGVVVKGGGDTHKLMGRLMALQDEGEEGSILLERHTDYEDRLSITSVSDANPLKERVNMFVDLINKEHEDFHLTLSYYELDTKNRQLTYTKMVIDQDYKVDLNEEDIEFNASNVAEHTTYIMTSDTMTKDGVGKFIINQIFNNQNLGKEVNDTLETGEDYLKMVMHLNQYHRELTGEFTINPLTKEEMEKVKESKLKPISEEEVYNYFKENGLEKVFMVGVTGSSKPYEYFKTIAKGLYEYSQR